MKSGHKIKCRGLVKGCARGPALVAREPISFLGDLEIETGRIVGELPSVKGATVGGKIVIMPGSSGSAGAWRFLYQMYKHDTHPLALVSLNLPDPSVVQGAILAGIPIVCEPEEDVMQTIESGDMIEVDGEGTLMILPDDTV
jgi:predicted aconitase with swiveling domain